MQTNTGADVQTCVDHGVSGFNCRPRMLIVLSAGESSSFMQKTSGADVRSVMDDIVTENRFEALSAPRSSAQPPAGAHAFHTEPKKH